MADLETVHLFNSNTLDLSVTAMAAASDLLDSLDLSGDPARVEAALARLLPDVTDPYYTLATELGQEYYATTRAAASTKAKQFPKYKPMPLEFPDAGLFASMAGFTTAPLKGESDATALSLLGGSVQKLIMNAFRYTITTNGAADLGVAVSYQRIPKAGCCAFCAMVAGNTSYKSKESAETVVGRGMEIPKEGTPKKRGRQPKGIRPRGKQALGDSYHDHCKCEAVPIFDGQRQELPEGSKDIYNDYTQAKEEAAKRAQLSFRTETNKDGSLRLREEWTDSVTGQALGKRGQTKLILQLMRENAGYR